MSLIAIFKMFANKYTAIAIVIFVALFVALSLHRDGVNKAVTEERMRILALNEKAAKESRERINQASEDYAIESETAKTKINYRTKEVIKYVDSKKDSGNGCVVDDEFIRLFNSNHSPAKAIRN